MPRLAKPLTDLACKTAKPILRNGKNYESVIVDGACKGLIFHVSPTGKKTWRIRYDVDGKQKNHTFANYPDTTLAQARAKLPETVASITEKTNQITSKEHTFRHVAEEWHSWKKSFPIKGKLPEPATIRKHRQALDLDLIPKLGDIQIEEIGRDRLKEVLLEINMRSNPVAVKAKQILSMILDYSVDEGYRNTPAPSTKNIVSILKKEKFKMPDDIIVEFEKCDLLDTKVGKLAMKLQHHVFMRSGEIMRSEWAEINWKAGLWNKPAQHMKMKRPHTIPLTRPVIRLLEELNQISGGTPFLFPAPGGKFKDKKPMNRDILSANFRDAGIPYHPHACRTIAGEWLKKHKTPPVLVEYLLAHKIGNTVQDAYEVAPHLYFLDERLEALTKWSNHLDTVNKSKPQFDNEVVW